MAKGFPSVSADVPGNPGFGAAPSIKSYGDFSSASSVSMKDLQGRFTTGGWGFVWTGLQGVLNLPNKMKDDISDNAERRLTQLAQEIESYAKANAPWQDRSGDARRGLKVTKDFNKKNGKFVINLGHSVKYGVYLEKSNGGAYAIVLPTMQHFAPLIAAAGGR